MALLVLTEPGRDLWTATTERAGDRATDWFTDALEENQAQRELRERLTAVESMCGDVMKPKGFDLGGQAIALVVGERRLGCDRIDLEAMGGIVDAPVWAVHVDAKKTGGCEVDGETGEVSNRYRSCE